MNEKGKFVSGEKRSFQARAGTKAVDIIFPPDLAQRFEVIQKGMPASLPESWDGFRLTWINNIGLQAKTAGAKLAQGEFYEIQFKKEPLPGSETIMVYWNGSKVVEIPSTDYGEAGKGMMAVRLNLIDPPIGIGGR
jgi:hypothetical protein